MADYQYIKDPGELKDFCARAAKSSHIGFDTEFVSENRYRPELCLVQVATDDELALIDTLELPDVDDFWALLANGEHVTIAHAAREEFLFCYRTCGKRPAKLFDVQLAAGFVGLEYPCSYGNLVSRLLGKSINKGETRTDWKRRPLSDSQIDYALQDVIHLRALHDKLVSSLEQMGRTTWLAEEIDVWQDSLERFEREPQWQRISGISSLKPAALAIVREVWLWRDREAKRKNRSPKRILPDDLVVEVAKRGTPDINRLKAIRGIQNRSASGSLPPISKAIQKAIDLPKSEYPPRMPRARTVSLGLLGQFLTTALNLVCHRSKIAPSLVGTAQDVRNVAAWRLGLMKLAEEPDLERGWRREIVGELIEKVLDGKIAIRVDDPKSDTPLIIEEM